MEYRYDFGTKNSIGAPYGLLKLYFLGPPIQWQLLSNMACPHSIHSEVQDLHFFAVTVSYGINSNEQEWQYHSNKKKCELFFT